MARISGIDIPRDKRVIASLRYIHGIGAKRAEDICVDLKIGGYWSTQKYIPKMNYFFKLKKNERCLGFFYMGKYDHVNTESKLRKSIIEKTEWNL